jgi:hypothetical protein
MECDKMVDNTNITPTGTKARYYQSQGKVVAQALGIDTNPDGSPQSLSDPGMEIVIINRIYPDSMTALVTYRETTDSTPVQETVMILSLMIDDSSKMLWLPPGTDVTDPVTNAVYRVPSQDTLTGIVINIGSDNTNEKVLIGYIRMQGEGVIAPDTSVILETDSPVVNLFNGTTFDYKIGDTEVIFDNEFVHITTPEFLVNGNSIEEETGTTAPTTGTWEVGQKIYNSTPTAGGYVGWICITTGTPGIWKRFGLIEED